MEPHSYNLFGTLAAPVELTDDPADNSKTLFAKGYSNLTINFKYTPLTGESNRYALILVEVSNDEGTTFVPIAIKQNTPGEILVYVNNADVTDGNPIVIPGTKTTTGGTVYEGSVTIEGIHADFVKISAQEDGSADFGELGARATLTP